MAFCEPATESDLRSPCSSRKGTRRPLRASGSRVSTPSSSTSRSPYSRRARRSVKSREIGAIDIAAGGIDLAQTGGDVAGNDSDIDGRSLDVRVAVDVNITRRAIQGGRFLEQIDTLRRRHVADRAVADLAVARLVDQHRRPQLEIEPGADEEVGVAKHQGVGRFGFDEMGVGSDRARSIPRPQADRHPPRARWRRRFPGS